MVRIGFVGFGRMGITHFSILNTHPSVEIAAVCEQSGTMNSILKKYIGCRLFTDHNQMMDEGGIDAVVVSTPSDSHAHIIRAAVERNLHVFTEKPFTMAAEEGRGILAMLKGRKIVNQVGYVNRFNEVFVEIKRLLDKDAVGEVKTFSSEMYGATVLKDSGSSWRGKRKTGGGCMYEFASHCIDLSVYLIGVPDKVTGNVMKSIYSSRVEDFVSSTFIYSSGAVGSILVNWCDETYRKPTNIFTILGTKGKIRADKHAYKLYLKEDRPDLDLNKGWTTRYITDFGKSTRFYVRGNEFTNQLDYFVDCIENGQGAVVSDFAEAIKTDIIMEQISRDVELELSGGHSESLSVMKAPFGGGNFNTLGWFKQFISRLWR